MYSNLPWHITTDLAEMFAQISFFEEVNTKVIFSFTQVHSIYTDCIEEKEKKPMTKMLYDLKQRA